jgi:hypothetical protein
MANERNVRLRVTLEDFARLLEIEPKKLQVLLTEGRFECEACGVGYQSSRREPRHFPARRLPL